MRLVLLLLLTTLLMSSGCDRSRGILDNSSSGEIIPLKVGNRWVYKLTQFDEEGDVLGSDQYAARVDRDTVLNNETWYFLVDANRILALATNRADGYWVREVTVLAGAVVGVGEPYLSAKYPATVGEMYPNDDDYVTTVTSTGTEVSIPAGAHDCYQYLRMSATRPYESTFYYRAPGVGTVLQELFASAGDTSSYRQFLLELTEVRLAQR